MKYVISFNLLTNIIHLLQFCKFNQRLRDNHVALSAIKLVNIWEILKICIIFVINK